MLYRSRDGGRTWQGQGRMKMDAYRLATMTIMMFSSAGARTVAGHGDATRVFVPNAAYGPGLINNFVMVADAASRSVQALSATTMRGSLRSPATMTTPHDRNRGRSLRHLWLFALPIPGAFALPAQGTERNCAPAE